MSWLKNFENESISFWEGSGNGKRQALYIMVNATKGLFISCDVPMAQFIVSYNASLPASQRFILHMLDSTHMFVQPHVAEMIRSRISEFRDQNTYEKPA
ncbi:hypothetical protein H6P81_009854 [Aristolochia fimbriata]|uniref:General transcription and DNA repair factor IIH subunit TFB5 n=1 Tax=Aristolochia fimbriata TaxID=158543 RepID=A0AAV7EN93_ARIFI|nr:hypothetical protein H6P81_009854 [Aristolochia fimbriata]